MRGATLLPTRRGYGITEQVGHSVQKHVAQNKNSLREKNSGPQADTLLDFLPPPVESSAVRRGGASRHLEQVGKKRIVTMLLYPADEQPSR